MASRRTVLSKLSPGEGRVLADIFRQETVGGALLLGAAITALIVANTSASSWYYDLKDTVVGPAALNLNLSLEEWGSDGLLAIFFFVAGLELKRELIVGSLSERSQAALPVVAALAGMIAPACIFLVVTVGDHSASKGWGIPMATDIAFALAVLAVVGSHLPPALRAFLLTLAIVDDMGAIAVIALFFTSTINLVPLFTAAALLVLYFFLQRRRVTSAWLYVPLGLIVWGLIHDSGVHATVAGVLLGLLTRVKPDTDENASPAERLEHRVRPISAGIAVPIFAFLTAGVTFSINGIFGIFDDVTAVGIVVGLVVGKLVGVFGASWVTARLTGAELDPSVSWLDMIGLALLSGIGFTVSLLMAELAYGDQPERLADAKLAILLASLTAAVLAAFVLQIRDRAYHRASAADT
jgi:NhaA family Na+:H+ antiporter